jgi:peptidyl-prolyl cis-trans isomerase C
MNAPNRIRLLAGVGAALAVAVAGLTAFGGGSSPQAQAAAPAAPDAAAAAAPGSAGAAAAARAGAGVVATVDGDPITELDLELAYQEFDEQLARFSFDQRREVTIDLLTHIRLLAKDAEQKGIPMEQAMAAKLRLVRERALYGEYLDRLFAMEVTESKARALFAEQQAKAGPAFEYKVSHILVPTIKEAQDIIIKLDNGGDFAQLAKDVSIDPGSAPEGGDLGFIASGETVKEFETAAFALEIGKYTKSPVESQFGFHVIRLDEKREAAPKTFEDSISDLQDTLAQNAFQKVLDELKTKYKVEKAAPPGLVPPGAQTQPAPQPR